MYSLNIELLNDYFSARGWSYIYVAKKLRISYSFSYRVLKGERGVGGKFISNFISFCIEEGIEVEQFFEEASYSHKNIVSGKGNLEGD